MNAMKSIAASALLTGAAAAFAQHHGHGAATPYAGLQSREIKALSREDTQALLEGRGMSLALAAELNGHPGPMHVLELGDALGLDAAQREGTRALMDQHKARARELGRRLVDAERELDRAFAAGGIAPADVERLTARIAALQGELRAEHLKTHLSQTRLLNTQQVAAYQRLRGYAAPTGAQR